MRTFVALELPSLIHDKLLNQIAHLQKTVGYRAVRWVNAGNIHLTLKFLGEIQPSQVEQIKQTLLQLARRATPFSLEIGGLGAFPNTKQPRILWVGVQAPAALEALQHGLEGAFAQIGYPLEDKSYAPHLTIGRVLRIASPDEIKRLRAAIEGTTIAPMATVAVDALHLFKSDLQPTGPVYTRLFSAEFGV